MTDSAWYFIHTDFLYPGLAGGLLHALRNEKTTPRRVVILILTGGVAANFLSPIFLFGALKVIDLPLEIAGPFVAFGIGMAGKKICHYIEMWFSSQKPLGKIENE